MTRLLPALVLLSAGSACIRPPSIDQGTLSVEVDEEKPSLYVHWINAETVEPKQTKAAIAGPFERFLTKVFG